MKNLGVNYGFLWFLMAISPCAMLFTLLANIIQISPITIVIIDVFLFLLQLLSAWIITMNFNLILEVKE
jgi:hypothetical protein